MADDGLVWRRIGSQAQCQILQ